jgi:hypothetical protein
MIRIILLTSLLLFSGLVYAGYKTPEFNEPNSSIAMMYMCTVVGDKQGYAKDTLFVLAKVRPKLGISIKKSGDLLNDAYRWYDIKKDSMDFEGLWYDLCETPIDNLRRMGG